MLSKNTKWETYLKASPISRCLNFNYKMKVMNLLHYTENTIDTRQIEFNFVNYQGTIHALFYVCEVLQGIQRKSEFGHGFSVVFTNLGACLFTFTLAVSLRDVRLVLNSWRYRGKICEDSLNTAILDHLCRFLNRLYWPICGNGFFHTKDTFVQFKDYQTVNDPVKLNFH